MDSAALNAVMDKSPKPMDILVVEDHEASAKALALMLERKIGQTARIHIASTLAEGLRVAREIKADITILDLNLPDAEVHDVIRSIPAFPPPVIVYTDLEDPDSKLEIECYANCCQNFFSKQSLRREIYDFSGAQLVSAITKAHWRRTLPKPEARQLQAVTASETAQAA